jgi:hypothetical protein
MSVITEWAKIILLLVIFSGALLKGFLQASGTHISKSEANFGVPCQYYSLPYQQNNDYINQLLGF